MLNVQRLTILHELGRLGTLAAVARQLSYSPSAVSQQLAQLEREVGVSLTEPIGRGIQLTPPACLLIEMTRDALQDLELAEATLIFQHGSVSGVLRVASFQSVLLSILPATLDSLSRTHPELRVDVTQLEADTANAGLLSGAFDVVLGEEYPGEPIGENDRLDRRDLGQDSLLLTTPPTGRWSGVTNLEELAEAHWAMDPADTVPGRWMRRLCRSHGFEPVIRFEGVDILVHLEMVASGRAVSVTPQLVGSKRLQAVQVTPLPEAPMRRLFTLTRSTRAAHPAIDAFREALAQGFDEESQRQDEDTLSRRPTNSGS